MGKTDESANVLPSSCKALKDQNWTCNAPKTKGISKKQIQTVQRQHGPLIASRYVCWLVRSGCHVGKQEDIFSGSRSSWEVNLPCPKKQALGLITHRFVQILLLARVQHKFMRKIIFMRKNQMAGTSNQSLLTIITICTQNCWRSYFLKVVHMQCWRICFLKVVHMQCCWTYVKIRSKKGLLSTKKEAILPAQ